MDDTRQQVAGFLARYDAGIARQAQAVRKHLASHFPRGYELVYDHYNALAAASARRRAPGCPRLGRRVSEVGDAVLPPGRGLPDPERILEGAGTRVRSVRLAPPARLQEPAVQALLHHVAATHAAEFAAAPKLSTIVSRCPPAAGATKAKRKPAS